MSFNTFGHLFRFTSFGESHGPAIGCVVDGCPPRIPLKQEDIQRELDRRRPGQSRFTTQRQEPDAVKIMSGVFTDERNGMQVTTGTPIMLMIENVDQRSKDYSEIKDKYRPGHAGYTYDVKYGIHDYRGGGRASARETAARVAAGAIARKIVPGLTVRGALVQMGPHKIDRSRWDWNAVEKNPFFCPDAKQAEFFEGYLDGIRKAGSSCGAVIEVVAEGVPAGLGAPVYAKLDGDLAGRFGCRARREVTAPVLRAVLPRWCVDRARPGGDLGATRHAELVEHVLDVRADGLGRHEQLAGDLGVGHALRNQPGDFELTRRERMPRLLFPGAAPG